VVVGWCVCKLRDGGGVGPKTRNRGFVARFRGRHVKRRCGVMLGGGGCGSMTWRLWGGCANVRPGGEIWAKNPKPSVRCSVSGAPCETAVWGDAGRWWVRINDMEAAGGLRMRQREARGRGLGRNRAFIARFRVRRVKRRCGVMLVGGGVARIRQWWWWGDAFANCEAEEGVWVKNPKPSVHRSVSGVLCEIAVWGNAGRWWGGSYKAVVVVGWCVRKFRGRGGVWVKNPKPSVCGSVAGAPCETAACSDAGRWWVQVGGTVAAGGLRVHHREAGGRGLCQKPGNRACVARFRACRVQRRCRKVAGGGGDPPLR